MKIAFFHHSLRIGSGIDTVIYEIATRLGKKEDVTIFCFVSNYEESDSSIRIRKIKSSFAVDTSHKVRFLLAPFILDKTTDLTTELQKFDVINTHLYPANYLVRNVKGPLNLVTEWSAGQPQMFSSYYERAYYKWLSHANKVAARRADRVIAPCEFVRKWIEQNYSIDATNMYLDGVNFDLFDRKFISSEKFFQRFPYLSGKKIVLFVGRITDSKNIHSLIQIFSVVRRNIGNVALVLAGDYFHYPHYYSKLLELIKVNNLEKDVILAGVVPWEELPSYFAACNVYATCSLWEGFLRAEAFAAGKPIVCFDVAANPETVKDSENGFLIESNNNDQFASRLEQLINNEKLAAQLGDSGYRWAKSNLDFDEIAKRFTVLCSAEISNFGSKRRQLS